jgi:predicted regulator of Ras-like GTPase activity (Roadblock/LC7/MglB family)
MNEFNESLAALENVPGVIGAVLVDSDGIPLAVVGDFDLPPEDLGAILATCFESLDNLGRGMGEFHVESIIAEYSQTKLIQQKMPRGTLIVMAEKLAPVGVIRLEAKRSFNRLNKIMENTRVARQDFMDEHKIRMSSSYRDASSGAKSLMDYLKKPT